MSSDEHPSLGYIEDPYFNPHDSTSTPSLDDPLPNKQHDEDHDGHIEIEATDDLSDSELDIFDLRQLEFDDPPGVSLSSLDMNDDSSVNVEAEFFHVKRANAILRTFFRDYRMRKQVRVTYCDLTKPYLAKLPRDSNFRKYLGFATDSEEAVAAGSELFDGSPMSESDREKQMETWRIELEQVESEISTLRAVLTTKMRRSAELKRQLGITAWKEISDDVNQGIKNVKDSNVYQAVEQKVEQVAKAVVDAPIYQKTSSLIGGITGGISTKLGQIRHSESFKSFEEKASTAIENVKTKVVSRSGSQQSLDGESAKSRSGSIVTSPTIPEDKPLA